MAWNSFFSLRPITMSFSERSVVIPRRNRASPVVRVPRLSHESPVQAIGPWTICATSAIGNSVICAPSKVQPPAVAPGFGRVQPPLALFALLAQAGSSISRAMSLVLIVGILSQLSMQSLCHGSKPVFSSPDTDRLCGDHDRTRPQAIVFCRDRDIDAPETDVLSHGKSLATDKPPRPPDEETA